MSSAVSIPKRAVIVQAHTLAFEPEVQWEPYLQLRLCQTTLLRSLALFVSAKWRHRDGKKGWSLVKILDKNDDEFEHPAETIWGALDLTPICVLLSCSLGNTASKDMRIILSFKLEGDHEHLIPALATFSRVNQARYGFQGTWRFSTAEQLDGRHGKEKAVNKPTTPTGTTTNSATGMSLSQSGWQDIGRRVTLPKVTSEKDASKIKLKTMDRPEYALSSGDTDSSSPYNLQSNPSVIVGTPVKGRLYSAEVSRSRPPLQGILKCSPSTKRKLDQTSNSTLLATTAFLSDNPPSTPKRNHHLTSNPPRGELTPIPIRGKRKRHVNKLTAMPAAHQSDSPEGAIGFTEKQHNSSPSEAEAESQDEVERNLELASRLAELQRLSR